MSALHWLGVVVALSSMYGCVVGFDRLERWAAKRRASRRSALERRMRARAHCTACGSIGRIEFRGEVQRLLGELAGTDAGRAIEALTGYGGRVAREERISG